MTPGNGRSNRIAEGENPVLDPTGDRLVFCTRQSNTAFGPMQSINADGSGRRKLFQTRSGACPTDWSADGESIAFNVLGGAGPMIGMVKQDGSNIRILGEGYGAHWSPDGKRLVFCRDGEKPRMATGIWVMNADGGHAEKITEDRSAVLEVGWLPEGSGIAFSSSRENHRSAIFAVNLDGTGLRKIAGNEKLNFYFPIFSPDGSQLIVDSTNGSGLEIVDLDLTTLHGNSIAKGGHPSVVWQKQ
jgi:TolB protein